MLSVTVDRRVLAVAPCRRGRWTLGLVISLAVFGCGERASAPTKAAPAVDAGHRAATTGGVAQERVEGTGAGTGASAPDPGGTTPALPSAKAILDRHVASCGGASAAEKIESLHIQSEVDLGAQGLKARAEYWWRRDGRFRQTQQVEGVGVLQSGYDGTAVWSSDPIFGMRVLEGAERAQAMWLSSPLSWARHADFIEQAKVLGRSRQGDAAQLDVALTLRGGGNATAHFDEATGRLRAIDMKFVSPSGAQPVHFEFEDYRAVGGYAMPHAQVLRAVTSDVRESYRAVEVNVPVDDATLAQPSAPPAGAISDESAP